MKPPQKSSNALPTNVDNLILTDFSGADGDYHRPTTAFSDDTTIADALSSHRSKDQPSTTDQKKKTTLMRFIPTFFEGFQEHIKSRFINGCILMVIPAVLFVFFGSAAWIDTAPFSSPNSSPSLKPLFVPSFPLFIGRPAPAGFHPRLLVSNRYTWPLVKVNVVCTLETFILQDDIGNVFPECGPQGDHSAYPFCLSPQLSFQNTSNDDGLVELVSFNVNGLPGAYKIKCTAEVYGSQNSTSFWVSLVGTVASVDASFADKFSTRIRIDTCGNTIPLPKVMVNVKNLDSSPIARQVHLVALQYPALVALGLHRHDDLASFAPGAPAVGIEHNSITAIGDLATSINAFLASWGANAFILAVVCEGRYKVLNYLHAPLPSRLPPPSQHIIISQCPQNYASWGAERGGGLGAGSGNARIQIINAPPAQIDSWTPFSFSVRMIPAPIAPVRALVYAYCPKCLDGTIRTSGILLKSKKLFSQSSTVSDSGAFSFSSASFSGFGEAGSYFYAIAVAGYIFPISAKTDVSSAPVLAHTWLSGCFIDCNLTYIDAGRTYYSGLPYTNFRFSTGVSAPSRTIKFAVQSKKTSVASIVAMNGGDLDEFGLVRPSSFSILVFKADGGDSLSLSAGSDSSLSTSTILAINGSIRHCVTPVLLCSYVHIMKGLPEYILGGTYFSGVIQGVAMSSKGDGLPVEICIFFEGVPAACSMADSSGNVTISGFLIPFPISSESSSLIIWYLAENPKNHPSDVATWKRSCGYMLACRSFTMAAFIFKNASSFFNAQITNGQFSSSQFYAVSNAFAISPSISLELSCVFLQSSLDCLALNYYIMSVKVVQAQQSSRATTTEGLANAQCTLIYGAKVAASCTFVQGILWLQLEVSFAGRVLREIYIHFSDPSVSATPYVPKYNNSVDFQPFGSLSDISAHGGSVRYINNMFFSTGIFESLKHPGLTLRINGTDIDIALSTSTIIDQTLSLSTPIIDRSILNLPDAPNLVNGSRVEIFSRVDFPVSPGSYALNLCFEFDPICFSSVAIPSITVLPPSLVASALAMPDYAVLSKRGGNVPTYGARVNQKNVLSVLDSDGWNFETVQWSLHDASKNVISSEFHSSTMSRHSNAAGTVQSRDAVSGNELFSDFLPVSFTPPVGFYHLSATSSCCGQRSFSNAFLVDYAVQSVSLLSVSPAVVVMSQAIVLSVDVRSLSGSGLPGGLVTVTAGDDTPASLCHTSACYGITNSLGIANVLFSVTMAPSGYIMFKVQSGNKATFFKSFILSAAASFKITKDIDATGAADITAKLPCAAALKLTTAIIVTSKPENDWANYNFPEFRVEDAAGNGVPGLRTSLRLLSCSLDGAVPSFVATDAGFSFRKVRAFGDGGSYAVDQFSLIKDSVTTDVYKLEIIVQGLGSVSTSPFLVRSVEVPDPVAVSTSRIFLMLGLPAVFVVLFANMRQRHFITFIIATGAIGFYALIALIYCSDALALKGLARAPSLMIASMLVMLLALAINTALCGVVLATYMIRTDYYDSNIRRIMIGVSALLTRVKEKFAEPQHEADAATEEKKSETIDLDAIIAAQEKPSIWKRLLTFFASKQVAMTSKSQAEILAELNAKKRKAMALLFKATGKDESKALSGFSFHSRMFSAMSISFIALLISFLICITLVDWLGILLGLGRAKVVQNRWANVRFDASPRMPPPLLFARDQRLSSISTESIGPKGIMFAVMDTMSHLGFDSYFYLVESLRSAVQLSCFIVFALHVYQWALSFTVFRQRVMEYREFPARTPLKKNPPSESVKLPAMQFWASLMSGLLLVLYFSLLNTIWIWKNSRDLALRLLLWPALVFGGVEGLVWMLQRYQQFHCIGAKNLFKHRKQFEQLDYICVHLQFFSYPGMSLLRLLIQIAEFGTALGRLEFDILPHEMRYWNPGLVSSNALIALDNAYNGPATSVMADILSKVLEERRDHERKLRSAYRKDIGRLDTYKQNLQTKRVNESRWKLLYTIVSSPQFLQTREQSLQAKLRLAPKEISWDSLASGSGRGPHLQPAMTKPTLRRAAALAQNTKGSVSANDN